MLTIGMFKNSFVKMLPINFVAIQKENATNESIKNNEGPFKMIALTQGEEAQFIPFNQI